MSEHEFQVVQKILSGMEIFVYGNLFAAFLAVFAQTVKEKKHIYMTTLVLYSGFYGLRLMAVDLPTWMGYLLISAVLMLSDWYRKRRLPVFPAFLITTWYCVNQIGFLIAASLYSAGSMYINRLLMREESLSRMLLWIMWLYAFTAVLRVTLMGALIWFIAEKIRRCMWQLKTREMFTLLILPVAGVLFGRMVLRLQLLVGENYYFSLYEEYPMYLWLVPLMATLFYAGIWASIGSYSNLLALGEERRRRFVEQRQHEAFGLRLEENRTLMEQTRSIRHELRGHMSVLEGFLEHGNYAGAKSYVRQMTEEVTQSAPLIDTENELMDVIISDAAARAASRGIRFSSEFLTGELADGFAYDLGIILSNLLTNAIEACKSGEDGWVKLSGGWKKNFFVLEVKNPCSHPVIFDEKNGLPQTCKEDRDMHGIGLKNVAALVKKYFGSMELTVEQQIFTAAVMLQEEGKRKEQL